MLYFAKREGRNQLDDFPKPFLNQWGANAEAIEEFTSKIGYLFRAVGKPDAGTNCPSVYSSSISLSLFIHLSIIPLPR